MSYKILLVTHIAEPRPPGVLVTEMGLMDYPEGGIISTLYDSGQEGEAGRANCNMMLRLALTGDRHVELVDQGDAREWESYAFHACTEWPDLSPLPEPEPEPAPAPAPQMEMFPVKGHSACDADEEGLPVALLVFAEKATARDKDTTQLLDYSAQRLRAGLKEYGTILRTPWAKGAQALREELGDVVNYSYTLDGDRGVEVGREIRELAVKAWKLLGSLEVE